MHEADNALFLTAVKETVRAKVARRFIEAGERKNQREGCFL
jgi:hypothetical protein